MEYRSATERSKLLTQATTWREEPWRHYLKKKKKNHKNTEAKHKRSHTVGFYWYEISRVAKSQILKADCRLQGAGG